MKTTFSKLCLLIIFHYTYNVINIPSTVLYIQDLGGYLFEKAKDRISLGNLSLKDVVPGQMQTLRTFHREGVYRHSLQLVRHNKYCTGLLYKNEEISKCEFQQFFKLL